MFYTFIRVFVGFIYRIAFRLRIEGLENIPREGPVIICGNHIHAFDPATILFTIKRPIYFLAKKELFQNGFAGWILRHMNAIALDREANDVAAYRAVVKALGNKKVVGIFAQGTRMKEMDIKSAKTGVALFALKSGAAVVPAFIDSSYKFFRPLSIKYGPPVDISRFEGQKLKTELLEEVTELIMTKISGLGGGSDGN